MFATAAKIAMRALVDEEAKAVLHKLTNDEFADREELDNLISELVKRLAFHHKRIETAEKLLDDARVPNHITVDGLPFPSLFARIEMLIKMSNDGHRFRVMKR